MSENELSREFFRVHAGKTFTLDDEEYEIRGSLGDGAVGIVRKAIRIRDERKFAVKFLAPDPKYIDYAVFGDVSARFKREGNRGTKLDHSHLLKIHKFDENLDGQRFESNYPKNPLLLMDRVEGKTLDSTVRKSFKSTKGKFHLTRTRLNLANQIADAISDLHRRKITHRDIKPANIFLSGRLSGDKTPVCILGDFGVVKWGDFHSSLSTGVLTATRQRGLGTLKYMSPEQAVSPRDVTVRADIFSFGITLFELFTGQILASPHHVFEIMSARLLRGNVFSRFMKLGYNLKPEDERIADLILDMHLRGATGRPSIEKVKGTLEFEYENRYGSEWDADIVWS